MDDLVRFDTELVKRLRREKGWTQAELAEQMGSVRVGWVRKVEAGKKVRLEWNGSSGVVNAGEDLAAALGVDLDTLILDSLNAGKIKRLRERRNQSPEQFAEHAQVSVDAVKRAEGGEFVHRVDTRSLAQALDVPAFELLHTEEAKGLNLDGEDTSLNMHAGMVSLGLSIQGRAKLLGKPIPTDEEARKEAHGRLMFAVWKLGKDVGTEGSSLSGNSSYVLAIETAIGSELASRSPIDPDSLPLMHAKRIASGLDENMISALSKCEALTWETLNYWMKRESPGLDWAAPDADLTTLCVAGYRSLAQAIFSNATGASKKLLEACAKEATTRIEFLCVFVSRHYPYFSRLSANDHGEFIRLAMLFVVASLASYAAGNPGRRLTFLDAVQIEEAARDYLSEARARIVEIFPRPE